MTPSEIDQAIDALPEDEQSELADAAVLDWRFRIQNDLMALVPFGSLYGLALAAHAVLRSFWPGSIIAATIATCLVLGAFWWLMQVLLSLRTTNWRIRRAMRRTYLARVGD
jgi:hypothetical protein